MTESFAGIDIARANIVCLPAHLAREGVSENTAPLATTIVAAVEGAVILSLAGRSADPLEPVNVHIAELIAHHRTSTPA